MKAMTSEALEETDMSTADSCCLVCGAPAHGATKKLLLQMATAVLLREPASESGALCVSCLKLVTQACKLHFQLCELDNQLRLRHIGSLYNQLGHEGLHQPGLAKQSTKGREDEGSDELACRLCSDRLNSAADLVRHIRSRHGAAPRTPPPCAPCTRCRCGRPASSGEEHPPASPDLPAERLHVDVTDGAGSDRPASTETNSDLAAAGDGGGGQLACAACPERFDSSPQRRRHLRQAHPRILAHACATCGKRFPSPSKLRIHEDSHAGARPHACHVCGRRYLSAQKLHVHVRSHTGERPFVCHMCGRTFAAAAYLVQHELTHTGRRPHQCHVCGKQFAQRGTMMKHVRSVHVGVTTHQMAAVGRTAASDPS